MNSNDFEKLKQKAKNAEASNKVFFAKLKQNKNKNLDDLVQGFDIEFFSKFDCLTCANCCRTLGPRLLSKDIERISKFLKISSSNFIEKYLIIDEDNDYVFKSMPCPFLESDNYCSVYEVRPKACKDYPHTSQSHFHKILNETLLNTFYCPAVYEIVEKLKNKIK